MLTKTRLGRTGLHASRIGLGCWGIGGPFENLGLSGGWDNFNNQDAKRGLLKGVEMGANIFDTADVYGLGKSERLLGWLVHTAQKKYEISRKNFILISKFGYFFGCAPHGYHPLQMRHQLEMSLSNLRCTYLDIWFFHHHDFGKDDKYLEKAIKQVRRLKQKGFIHYIGLRGPHQFLPYRKMHRESLAESFDRFFYLAEKINPDVISVKYNLLDSEIVDYKIDIFKWARKNDLGVLLYEPLAHGLLTNKYTPGNVPSFSKGDHRNRKVWFTREGIQILSSALSQIGKEFGCNSTKDFVNLAIRYSLSVDKKAVLFVGFRNEQQITESLSTKGVLSEHEQRKIKRIIQSAKKEKEKLVK